MSRVLIFVAVTGSVAAGCAGVIGIGDVHSGEESLDSAATPTSEASAPVDSGTDVAQVQNEAGADAPVIIVGKRVFVSSATTNGSIGGTKGADAICTAAGAPLGGTWVAWISNLEDDAIERIKSNGPWSRLDGALVASNRSQLTSGVLTNPISLTEKMEVPSYPLEAWTGTNSQGGLGAETCSDWTSPQPSSKGTAGSTLSTTSTWTVSANESCVTPMHIYCFEQ